jgi:hypothetical protein
LSLEALVQLTMGGPMPIYNGGMLQVSLRYYDDTAKRPGLPPDVAALISRAEVDEVTLTLCNLHVHKSRSLILQGGAYGEHNLISIESDGVITDIGSRWLRIELAPATNIVCRIKLARYVNQPSYIEPF